jgi:pimeloyl-ACP methyl ester carboxylesterase
MTPVLLIHSSGLTSRQWRRLADRLAPRHRMIAPDLLGYGAERWPAGEPFHFRQDVAMLSSLLDEPAHVVGHSYGGFLALQLALARPELVRRLAVYEPVTFGLLDEPEDAAPRAAIDQVGPYRPAAAGLDESWLERFADWWQGPGTWRALPPQVRQAFCDVGWKVSQEVASLSADRTDRARYATITAPTLILAGERTQPAELHVVRKLARTLPNAKLELFPELGHMGPITGGGAVNAAIAAFLES